MADDSTVTADDVDDLNRMALNRSSAIARIVGTGIVVVGIFGFLCWLWLTVRAQQNLDESGGFFANVSDAPDVSMKERFDLLAGTASLLMFAGLAIGLGLFLRVAADAGQTYAGGSVTGFQVGEPVDGDEHVED